MINDLKQKILSGNYTEEDLLVFADSIGNNCGEMITLLYNYFKIQERLENLRLDGNISKKNFNILLDHKKFFIDSFHIDGAIVCQNFCEKYDDYFSLVNSLSISVNSPSTIRKIHSFLLKFNKTINIDNLKINISSLDEIKLYNELFFNTFRSKNIDIFDYYFTIDKYNHIFEYENVNNVSLHCMYNYSLGTIANFELVFNDKVLSKLRFIRINIRNLDNDTMNKYNKMIFVRPNDIKEIYIESQAVLISYNRKMMNDFLNQNKITKFRFDISTSYVQKFTVEDIFEGVELKVQNIRKYFKTNLRLENESFKDKLENYGIILE